MSKVPDECRVSIDIESWLVTKSGDEVGLRDEAGSSFCVDKLGRCFVTEGPMRDIFGQVRNRVEIPDPFCGYLKGVIKEVLIRRFE